MERKPVISIKQIYTDYFLEKVFPAIRAKILFQMHAPAIVQQDNARLHIEPNNPSIIQGGLTSGSNQNIQVACQLPKSPYFNLLLRTIFKPFKAYNVKLRLVSLKKR